MRSVCYDHLWTCSCPWNLAPSQLSALSSQPPNLLDGAASRHTDEIAWLQHVEWLAHSKGQFLSFLALLWICHFDSLWYTVVVPGSPGGLQLPCLISAVLHMNIWPAVDFRDYITTRWKPCLFDAVALVWTAKLFQASPWLLGLLHLDWVVEFESDRPMAIWKYTKEQKEASVFCFLSPQPEEWSHVHVLTSNRSALFLFDLLLIFI